jgi:ABC-type transporter Mla subunit MlaD
VQPPQESSEPQQHISIAERIAPELHAIVDRTLEHVAVLQAEAVREARDQAQEARRREREAFKRLLGGLSRHSEELGRLADSVSDIAGSLRQELETIDAAVAKLTGSAPLHEPHAPDRTG